MASIRISEKKGVFSVTVDEYPEIQFTEDTYDKARDKAVMLVKEEIQKTVPQTIEEEETAPVRVKMGFAA